MAVYQNYFDIVRIFIEKLTVDINGKAEWMNNSTALCIAAKTGNRDIVMYLIKHGANINVTDVYNVSPLGRALMNMHEDVAEILIDHGADVSLKMSRLKKTPLHLSAGNGMRNIVQVLLEKEGANVNAMDSNKVTHLGIAIMNMHEEIAEILINHGADVFMKIGKLQQTPLHLSSAKGMDNIVKILLEKGASTGKRDKRGRTPLHRACINGHACIVDMLLKYDSSQVNKRAFCNTKKGRKGSNIRGFTALHYAASQGYVDVIDVVLQAGGEVNLKDSFGQTPLYVASNFGHLAVVQLLVSRGANVNIAENHGFTPLHVAVYRQRTDVVKFLADRATIDALDKYGKTPLHVACQKGYIDIVKLLLTNNSNWRLSTYTDNTVLHYACRYGHAEIAEEFAKRDKEMLYVENASKSDCRKVPFKEALLYRRHKVVEMLQSMQMPRPDELPYEIYVSEMNNNRQYRIVIKQE